jgi:hypothetical protein
MTIDAMMRDIRVISLDQIKLDQENVRFGNDVAQNQREAIKLMLSNPEDAKKILRLAEHIVENGLDPTELQLVTPDDEGNFIVLEGTRHGSKPQSNSRSAMAFRPEEHDCAREHR